MINRRKFIRNSGLALAGLGLTKGNLAAAVRTAPLEKNVPVYVNGTVKNKDKGIANVSVSDGINVVKTDSSGYYEITTDNSQRFIFISLPSGYNIPQNSQGTARFYQKIPSAASNEVSLQFNLEKTDVSDDDHYFMLLADPQTLDNEDMGKLYSEAVPDIKDTVSALNTRNIFGVSCGDIMYDNLDLYPDYERAVFETGIPFFQVLGNHDLELLSLTDEDSSVTFEDRFGPRYYSFNKGKIHYVVLDDVFWFGGGYMGYLDKKQLDWLKADLEHVEKGSTVIIFTHIPAYCEIHKRNGAEEPRNSVVITNRKELYKILEAYKSYILCGHTHESEYLIEETNEIHIGGAVCGAWWTGPICRDGTPKGYTLYHAEGDEISWKYKSFGKESDHQMRIYGKGSIPEFKDQIVANIWSADKFWEIKWFEDGVEKGRMERINAMDPLAVKLYQGGDKPEKHKWVEPYNTDHLFIAKPAPDAEKIRVTAKDRWGNIYSEEMILG